MAGVPPLRAAVYAFNVALVSQADTDIFRVNPTLAVGDVKVSLDGGSLNNITVLPTAIDAGALLAVDLSIAEMTADRIVVVFSDAAGAEWQDQLFMIETETIQINELAAAVWDEGLTGATHNVPTSAGRRLRALASVAVRTETAQAGTANTITLDAGASGTDNMYLGDVIIITGGTGIGQTKTIVDYDGGTQIATVRGEWVTNPANDSDFTIVANSDIEHLSHGMVQAATAGTVTLAATEPAVAGFYKNAWAHIASGLGVNQVRLITAYDGATQIATIEPDWATVPDATSIYHVDIAAAVDVGEISTCDIADAVLDDLIGDGTLTVRQTLRIAVAMLAGDLERDDNTYRFRDLADTVNRIVGTVNALGDRVITEVNV